MYGRGMYGGRGWGMHGRRTRLLARRGRRLVASVVAGGPAEKAGLKQGDVILSVDGTTADATNTLGDLIAAKKAGDTVTLSVRTQGQAPRDVKVALEKNPSKDAPYLGVQYSMGPQWAGRGGMGPGMMQGIFVGDVTANSPAAKAGIAPRDIITKVDGAVVNDPQQVVDAVGTHTPGQTHDGHRVQHARRHDERPHRHPGTKPERLLQGLAGRLDDRPGLPWAG